MGNEAPGTPPPVDAAASRREAIRSYRESAEKNPQQHLEKLLVQAVSYMVNSTETYNRRKQVYDEHMKEYQEDPSQNKKPFPDPYLTNYEAARDQVAELVKDIIDPEELVSMWKNERLGEVAEKLLAQKAPDKVKGMANQIWIRSVFPNRPMVGNEVDSKGVRRITFSRIGNETADSFLTIYPSGAIKVRLAGEEKDPIAPPFPDVFLKQV